MDENQPKTARVFAYNELTGKGSASFESELDGKTVLSVIEFNMNNYCVLEIEDEAIQWQRHGTYATPNLHFTEIVYIDTSSAVLWTEAERYRRVSLDAKQARWSTPPLRGNPTYVGL